MCLGQDFLQLKVDPWMKVKLKETFSFQVRYNRNRGFHLLTHFHDQLFDLGGIDPVRKEED